MSVTRAWIATPDGNTSGVSIEAGGDLTVVGASSLGEALSSPDLTGAYLQLNNVDNVNIDLLPVGVSWADFVAGGSNPATVGQLPTNATIEQLTIEMTLKSSDSLQLDQVNISPYVNAQASGTSQPHGYLYTESPTIPADEWVTIVLTTNRSALLSMLSSRLSAPMTEPGFIAVANQMGGLMVSIGQFDTINHLLITYLALQIDVVAVAPPQRQYPRNDGLGISTKRSWPPPTSKQFGLRRGSVGTYW